VSEHKAKAIPGFTSKYHMNRLVCFEETSDVLAVISREKEIKGWTRARKIALIESTNPRWDDLSEGWFDAASTSAPFAEHEAVVAQNDRWRVRE
jgi:putative endonuclease